MSPGNPRSLLLVLRYVHNQGRLRRDACNVLRTAVYHNPTK